VCAFCASLATRSSVVVWLLGFVLGRVWGCVFGFVVVTLVAFTKL